MPNSLSNLIFSFTEFYHLRATNWGKITFISLHASRKTPAPSRNEHEKFKCATALITCRVWSSLCHGCTCVGVHKLCFFCVCVYVFVHECVCVRVSVCVCVCISHRGANLSRLSTSGIYSASCSCCNRDVFNGI